MHIAKSNLALASKHDLKNEALQAIRLDRPLRADASFRKLLDEKLQAPPARLLAIENPGASEKAAENRKESPFKSLMELLFGLKIGAEGGPPGLRPLPSLDGQRLELIHRKETESCSFSASGNVCLADGSKRQFEVSYEMERSEETTTLGAGLRDPLVVDLPSPGSAADWQTVEFDLDSDGQAEDVRMPGGDTAILFRDINKNGRADDGSELFGPRTNDGFDELAALDADGNGWVDGGDAAFAELMLWQIREGGESSTRSLAEAGIGALSTASAETPFTLRSDGETQGQMRSSSVWLGEEGGAGIVRQIDFATIPKETQTA